MLVPIIAMAILMGVLPNLFLRPMEPSVAADARPGPSGAPTRIQAAARPDRHRACQLRWPSQRPETADMFSSFNAIVPMACVTAAGIAAMMAEAFRAPGERMPIGPLGVDRPGRRGDRHVRCSWDRNAASFGVVVADNFGLFVTGDPDRRRRPVAGDLRRRPSSASACRAASTTR